MKKTSKNFTKYDCNFEDHLLKIHYVKPSFDVNGCRSIKGKTTVALLKSCKYPDFWGLINNNGIGKSSLSSFF